MKKFLALALLLCTALHADVIKPISYQATPPNFSDKYDDPNRNKLTDGISSPENRILWSIKKNNKKPVVIDFTFAEPVALDGVTIFYSRQQKSYGIKRINVFGSGADDSQFALGHVILDQPYQIPEGQKQGETEKETIKLDPSRRAEKVRVEIIGNASNLALHEIEFTGSTEIAQVVTQEKGLAANPLQKYASSRQDGLKVAQTDGFYILENNSVMYIVDPANCGRVQLAYDKKNKFNFIKYAAKDDFGGMFNDRFWPGGYDVRDMFRDIPYQAEMVGNNAVRVTADGKSGIFTNVTVEKTYRLEADSPVLRVDYKVTNDQANVVPLQYGLWLMGGVGSEQAFELVFPGVYRMERYPNKPQRVYSTHASAPWCAAVTGDGKGLAFICDFELMKMFSFWSNSTVSSTMECRLGIYAINANDSLHTSFFLVPFAGLGVPDQVNPVMAGCLNLPEESASPSPPPLKLLPLKPGEYQVTVEAGKLSKGQLEFQTVHQTIIRGTGEVAEISYPLNFTGGTWVIRVKATSHGQEVFSMTGSTVYKRGSGTYPLPAAGVKRPESGVEEKKLDLNFNSLAVETPHIKWAKPYAGGKPKVLGVTYQKGGIRDLVETAQRFDLDLTTNYIAGQWALSGFTTSLNENDCYNELAKQLKNKFDCIVVSSWVWDKMPGGVRNEILRQVREGSGLILIAPEEHPEELAKFFKLLPVKRHLTGPWSSTTSHPITEGIPFKALPPTRGLPYETSGQVLAKLGEHPLLSVFEYGKGKVVAAAWAVDGRDRSDYHRRNAQPAVLPLMLFNLPQDIDYHYWEYHISLLAKMIYWSTGSNTNINGKELQASPGKLTFNLSATKKQDVTAELTIRDKYSQEVLTQKKSLSLNPGANSCEIDFSALSAHGLHLADLIIRGEKGVEWWGSAEFINRRPLHIEKLNLTEKIYRKDESLKGKVVLSETGEVRVTLFDSFGNEFARATGSDFELPLRDCRTLTCKLVVECDGDRLEKDLMLYGKPDPRRMKVIFIRQILSQCGIQAFLIPEYQKRLIELGGNGLVAFHTDTDFELQEARKLNLPILCSPSQASAGGKFPFDRNAKIKSKFDLIRKPCLSAPGFKEGLAAKSAAGNHYEQYGVLFRLGSDEANSIVNWEGCFSPDCQREFRKWLQGQYGSLEALNQSWMTSYKSWDEVYAMTSDEVRNHPSYAPWLDHRTFNDWNHADAIGYIVKGMKQANPELRFAMSGTQDANAFNAWDWYRLMQHFEALQGYMGEQMTMQRCFARDSLIWQSCNGYDRSRESLDMEVLRRIMQGVSGFSIYSGRIYVNPDYTFPKAALDLKAVFERYGQGRGEAIINSEFVSCPIALLYSPASIKMDWILDSDDIRRGAVQGYRNIFGDLGLTYDYVASTQLETSDILSKYKILVLPMTAALSDKEAEAIRRFVRSGGTVIADMAPGAFDIHGKKNAQMPLDDVFGLKTGNWQFVKGDARLEWQNETPLPLKAFDNGVTLTTATAQAFVSLDGKKYPAVAINRFGQGQAIYFGCTLPNIISEWAEMRFTANNQKHFNKVKDFFKVLTDQAQIKPQALVPGLIATEQATRRNGPAYIIGVARNPAQTANLDPKPQVRTVNLDGSYHIYDLLERKYLGSGDKFDYEFGPTTQSAFVLIPYKVEKPTAKLQQQGSQLTADITANAQTNSWADHHYYVELIQPDGKANPAYTEVVFGKANQAQYQCTLPQNAAKGEWQLRVTEILTGEQTITTFQY